jgi:hypothetical protein
MTASAGLDTASARDRCGASSSCGGNAMDLSRCAVPSLCHPTVSVIANRSGQRVFIKPEGENVMNCYVCDELDAQLQQSRAVTTAPLLFAESTWTTT